MCDRLGICMSLISIQLGIICLLLGFVVNELKKQTKWMEEE